MTVCACACDARTLCCLQRVSGRKATIEELKSCHSEAYSLLYGTDPQKLAESHINREMFGTFLTYMYVYTLE